MYPVVQIIEGFFLEGASLFLEYHGLLGLLFFWLGRTFIYYCTCSLMRLCAICHDYYYRTSIVVVSTMCIYIKRQMYIDETNKGLIYVII